MMKNCVLILLVTCLTALNAADMGQIEDATKRLRIKSDFYQVEFFPGHMFPVWFKTPDGVEFPRVRFMDFFYDTGSKKSYPLRRDRWAEQNIVENTPERIVIECSGTYCSEDSTTEAPGKPRTVYRYTFHRDSDRIAIEGRFSRESDAECTVTFIQPYWLGSPFGQALLDGKAASFSGKASRFTAGNELVLQNDQIRFGVSGTKITAWNNTDNKTYCWIRPYHLEKFKQKNFEFKLELIAGPANNKLEGTTK